MRITGNVDVCVVKAITTFVVLFLTGCSNLTIRKQAGSATMSATEAAAIVREWQKLEDADRNYLWHANETFSLPHTSVTEEAIKTHAILMDAIVFKDPTTSFSYERPGRVTHKRVFTIQFADVATLKTRSTKHLKHVVLYDNSGSEMLGFGCITEEWVEKLAAALLVLCPHAR